MMPSTIIVLDINGVLADVRKRSCRDCAHDLTIPSGQRVYMRPRLHEFCDALRMLCGDTSEIVLWTSRKRVNAEPIERLLADEYGLRAKAYLHGEDCRHMVGFHPVKDAATVRRIMRREGSCRVVFVDDSPERIRLDRDSTAIRVRTYDAADRDRTWSGLGDVIEMLPAKI